MEFLRKLFESDFMPHGHCYYWLPEIVYTNAISDSVIAIAYFTIPISLVYIIKTRKDFKYYWLILLFAVFILGCGATHVMDVINIWKPIYRLDSSFRVITALASIGTAFMLIQLTPRIILIPNAEVFRDLNNNLRKQLLELEDNRHFIQSIAEATPNNIYVFDIIHNKSIYINNYIEEALGYTVEQIQEMGNTFLPKIMHPEDLPVAMEYFATFDSISEKEVRTLEYRLLDSQGKWHWFFSRDKIFKKDAHGKVTQILGVATDITSRKESEDLLNASRKELKIMNEKLEERVNERTRELSEKTEMLNAKEKQLMLIANSIPAFISYIDTSLNYQFVNEYYELLGISSDQIIGKKIWEIIGMEEYLQSKSFIEQALQGKKITYDRKFTLLDQSEKHFKINYVPDKYQDGTIKGLIVMGIDMTDRINYEQTLETKNAELIRINRDLDNFIYTASHDLKAPISNMEGLLTMIYDETKEKCTEDVHHLFSLVKISIEKLKVTINELTQISHIQRNFFEESENIHLQDLIDEFEVNCSGQIQESHAQIHSSLLIPEINFSKRNLRSILYNLLINAIKYRHRERTPEITIQTVQYDSHTILLSVSDNGIGMDTSQKDKIFGMFKRLHDHVEGTGVGLYIVKRIIENAGGSIDVESEIGKGSVFKVYLKKISSMKNY